jgi:predicted Na+-dependent transporter
MVSQSRLVRINGFIRKHFIHLISLVALLAFLAPGTANAVRRPKALDGDLDAATVSLFFMMLSAAINCGIGAFRSVVQRPKPHLVCLAQFFLVLPLSCWVLGQMCVPLLGRDLGQQIQLGIDLVILMPVAATSTIWVRDTKGDLELLVSLLFVTKAVGTLTAPFYLAYMSGLGANSIAIPKLVMLRHLAIGVLLPLCVGLTLNQILRKRLPRFLPYFSFLGSMGLFLAVFLNVGTAAPLLKQWSATQIAGAMAIVLAVNLVNFVLGSIAGRIAGLRRNSQVTCEFSSGMRSNGTALVVGLASFPHAPLVTVPAAIYIIFQHLLAGIVRSRLVARFGDGERASAAAARAA